MVECEVATKFKVREFIEQLLNFFCRHGVHDAGTIGVLSLAQAIGLSTAEETVPIAVRLKFDDHSLK